MVIPKNHNIKIFNNAMAGESEYSSIYEKIRYMVHAQNKYQSSAEENNEKFTPFLIIIIFYAHKLTRLLTHIYIVH